MSKIVKIDIDSVIRDIHTEMLKVYNSSIYCEKKMSYEDLKYFDVTKTFPDLFDPAYFFFSTHASQVFGRAELCDNALEGLYKLKEAGHKIILVSAQLRHNMAITINWLNKNAVPFDELCFVTDKSIVKGDYILDDNIDNLFSCVSKGECAICLTRPWNDKWTGQRVSSILEFADLLEKLSLQNIK